MIMNVPKSEGPTKPPISIEPATVLQQPTSSGISVLIVGAGVGGVTAALECWRKGHQVRIIEKAVCTDLSGDFFTIGPSGLALLRHWPRMVEENESISYNPWVSYHKQTGECVIPAGKMNLGMTGRSTDKKLPSRIYRHHRPRFMQMLLKQLKQTGIEVQYDQRVVDYYEDLQAEKGGVLLDNGRTIEADIVIAADGLGTKAHKLVAGHQIKARSSGYAIYRTAFPTSVAFKDLMVAERFKMPKNGQTTVEMWAGPDMHLFAWNAGDIMSWLITHKDTGTAAETWSNTVPIEDVLKYTSTVEGWPEVMDRLIKTTPTEGLVDWKLMWRDPQPKWCSPEARVVQLGDSAHTFLPSSGNGATMGMEDAISIAACLAIGGKSNVPLAAKVHNKLRFERVSCCQKLGVFNQNAYQKTDWDAVAKNPELLKARYGYWIWSHDAEKYAEDNFMSAAENIRCGATFANTNIPPGHIYKPWSIDTLLAAHEKAGGRAVETGDWS